MANLAEFTGDIVAHEVQTAESILYRFVVLTGSTRAIRKVVRAGNGVDALGIYADGKVPIGDHAGVALNGLGMLEVDGDVAAIAVGDRLDPDAAGKGTKVATNLLGYSAIALEPAVIDGAIIRVLIERGDIATA